MDHAGYNNTYILVYSPERIYRKLYIANLLARGYPAVEAASFNEAQLVASTTTVSLILLCCARFMGEERLREIRACTGFEDVPLIVISSEALHSDWEKRWNIAAYCDNPGDIARVLSIIEPYLPPRMNSDRLFASR